MSSAAPLEYLEVRGESWNAAADQLVAAISAKALDVGQLKWVDAHNNDPDGPSIFMACWSSAAPAISSVGMKRKAPNGEQLCLEYHQIDSAEEWPVLYEQACTFCRRLHVGQLVSVTCSCNSGGRHMCYVFYDASSVWEETPGSALQLQWVQASAGSWLSAAQMISQQLGNVASTQKVLAIDAHNSSPTAAARFVAFFDAHLAAPPGRIGFVHQNATYGWDQFYRRAMDFADFGLQTISITGSNNENGKAVMFVWYYEEVGKPVFPVPPLTRTLSVMSFNIWCNGGDSLSRTCEVIRHSNPDVAGLQECSIETARILALKLRMYYAGNKGGEKGRQSVLSRWPIEPLDGEVCNAGFKILPPNAPEIAMYNVHLTAYPYAPYELHHYHKSAVTVEAIEHKTQFPSLSPVLRAMRPRMAGSQIVLLTGDFNAASHVDYPAGPIFPCSTACAALGLVDSFDDARSRGVACGCANTWSSKAAQEPHGIHDRIDFVYYSRSSGLKVQESRHLDESNSGVPKYPSDHRAVLTIFQVLDCAESTEPHDATS